MLEFILNIIMISLAVASISYTISKSHIFNSVRKCVYARSYFWGTLLKCPYCISHWISVLALLFTYSTYSITKSAILDFIIVTFAVVSLSSIIIGKIHSAFEFME